MDDHSGIRCQAFTYREDQNVYTAGVCDSHVLGTRETVLPTLTRGSHLKYALDHYHKPSLHTQYPYMNLSLPPSPPPYSSSSAQFISAICNHHQDQGSIYNRDRDGIVSADGAGWMGRWVGTCCDANNLKLLMEKGSVHTPCHAEDWSGSVQWRGIFC